MQVKLNLGCGPRYQKGFINVDAYDHSVADLVCDLVSLPFKNNHFEVILCNHVIEHLGYIRTLFALAECYRVLKPFGRLIIETPDMESSFQAFLNNRSTEHRSACLAWIFGHDSPGQLHRILFPKELLKTILQNAGFIYVQFKPQQTHLYREGYRVEARSLQSKIQTIISEFYQQLLSERIIDIDNYFECLDFERVFVRNIKAFQRTNFQDKIHVIENLIYCPKAARLWLILLQKNKFKIKSLKKFIQLSGILTDLSLPTRLMRHTFDLMEQPLDYDNVFEYTHSKVLKVIMDHLEYSSEDVAEKLKQKFPKRHLKTNTFFSLRQVTSEVNILQNKGIKYMVVGEYDRAAKYLRLAINSGINSLFATINYAVLNGLCGLYKQAAQLYLAVLTEQHEYAIFDLAAEEAIKSFIHCHRYDLAKKTSNRFKPENLKQFWKLIIRYHQKDEKECTQDFKTLADKGFKHPLLQYYLNPTLTNKKDVCELLPLRTTAVLPGEGVHHELAL